MIQNLVIFLTKFGSHLYGTDTPASDLDFKGIFLPSSKDILLQRVRGTISNQRAKVDHEKNFAGEVDKELYSLQKFLDLCAEGQTVALDILFAPPEFAVFPPHQAWQELQENRWRLVTRRSSSFLGYCRTQANKYGIKGSRVSAARLAFELLGIELGRRGTTAKLIECQEVIIQLTSNQDHMRLLDIEGATDVHGHKRVVRHWEVCNRKMPLTQTIKSAHEVMRRIVEEYGHRARQAETNQGVDWKALSHAVRIGYQAIELLQNGHITFPRPEAAHLKRIKLGQYLYQQVAEEIEQLLDQVELESIVSTLRESADTDWIDSFIIKYYRQTVQSE